MSENEIYRKKPDPNLNGFGAKRVRFPEMQSIFKLDGDPPSLNSIIAKIYFKSDERFSISQDDKNALIEMCNFCQKMIANGYIIKLKFEGHADRTGGIEYNNKLSCDRANTIKEYVDSILSSTRKYYGTSTSSFGNFSDNTLSNDRRVDISLWYKKFTKIEDGSKINFQDKVLVPAKWIAQIEVHNTYYFDRRKREHQRFSIVTSIIEDNILIDKSDEKNKCIWRSETLYDWNNFRNKSLMDLVFMVKISISIFRYQATFNPDDEKKLISNGWRKIKDMDKGDENKKFKNWDEYLRSNPVKINDEVGVPLIKFRLLNKSY